MLSLGTWMHFTGNFFKLNLLGCHWLAKPYRFQVYNSKKHHLHMVSRAHHPRQSLFLSPLFPPLPTSTSTHPLSLWLSSQFCLWLCVMYICLWLIPSSFIQSSLHPSDICQSLQCIHASISVLFVSLFYSLDSIYTWDYMVFVFLWLAYFT